MLFERLFRELEKKKIRYLVVGGIAVNLHGYYRATSDLDLYISLDDANVRKFICIAKKFRYLPRIPVKLEDFIDSKKRKEWIQKKHMKVFSISDPNNPLEHIDVLVIHEKDFEKFYLRREKIPFKNIQLSVIAIPDLIKMKRKAGRGIDLIDIGALNHIEKTKKKKSRPAR